MKTIAVEEDVDGKKGAPEKLTLPASLINTYFQIFEVAVNKTKATSGKNKAKTNAELDQAMKSRLLGALLTGVNRAHPYLPSNDTGMEQHIDSLYRIAHVAPPSACTQALMLLFHLAVGSKTSNDDGTPEQANVKSDDARSTKTRRQDRFYRALYSKVADPTMLFGRQLTLYFNLVYKAMKNDSNTSRVVAFGKRLFHVAFHYNPAVISGTLFLLSEVMKHQPALSSSAFTIDGHMAKFDPSKREPSAAFSSVVHESKADDEGSEDGVEKTADADTCSLWELSLTLHHYHPTVCKFSSTIGSIEYNGDPLRDFTLAPFLDKFAFRNPKSLQKIKNRFRRGESVGERRSGLQEGVNAMQALPVNDPDFWKKQKNVSEQDEFFQQFFTERSKRDELKGIVRGKKEEDVDALDEAEGKKVDFDWDTDEEEDAFVQNLAESMMKNSGEQVEFDNEDPDMDGWSDYGGSDDDEDDDENAFDAMDGDLEGGADAMLDEDSDDDDDDDEIGDDGEETDEGEEMPLAPEEDNESDSDDELGPTFIEDLEVDESDEDDDAESNSASKKNGKRAAPESSFADSSEYEHLIKDTYEGRKRSNSITSMDADDIETSTPKKANKKRKRGKKKSKKAVLE